MTTQQDEIIATLQSAMQLEKNGIKFYGTAAGRTKNPRGKATFISLVHDEQAHLDVIRHEAENIQKTAKWLDFRQVLSEELASQRAPEIFPQEEEEIEQIVEPESSDLDALRLAAKMEEESYSFYAAAAGKTQDPDGKALYTFLANQETDHLRLINNTLGFLENPGEWFAGEEKPVMEG